MTEPLHDYIDIDVKRLSTDGYYTQEIQLDDGNWIFTFHYNDVDHSVTVDVSNYDEGIYFGEPLVLGVDLWRGINDPRLPKETLVPLSTDQDDHIDLDNLNRSVFLCIDDLGGDQ